MPDHRPWLLPDGVRELLPPDAQRIELFSRRALDLLDSYGYAQVSPPLLEYLDSLLAGIGASLRLKTLQLVDQMNGRMMGLRADFTPQVARIDARYMRHDSADRLCYLGPVLRARKAGPGLVRNPLQLGAEIYGHHGLESDGEILSLLLQILAQAGLKELTLDLGHAAIYHSLAQLYHLDETISNPLFSLIQQKNRPAITAFLHRQNSPAAAREDFLLLTRMHGPVAILEQAKESLGKRSSTCQQALDYLQQLGSHIQDMHPEVTLHYDLAEQHGFDYHHGLLFAAYHASHGHPLARGGRYDNIGDVFGKPRPATGFSLDLDTLVLQAAWQPPARKRIFAPLNKDPALLSLIRHHRDHGDRVVQALSASDNAAMLDCSLHFVCHSGHWSVQPL